MGLPGHRRTSSHKRRRAAHFALGKPTVNTCSKCGETILPHRACSKCGTYKGRQVVTADKKIKKAVKAAKKK